MAETGILTKMYQQGGDQISFNEQSREYIQTWKGPWSEIMKLYSPNMSVLGTMINIGMAFTPSENWISYYPMSNSYDWIIKSYSVQQDEAGDHGILRLTLVPKNKSDAYYDVAESWTLTWGYWQANATAYCSDGQLSGNLSAQNTYSVNVRHAVDYQRSQNAAEVLSCWTENGVPYQLNKGEFKIAQMYSREIQPTLKFPIVTFRKGWTGLSASTDAEIPQWGSNMNVLSNDFTLPETASYIDPGTPSFLPGAEWKWILRDYMVERQDTNVVHLPNNDVQLFNLSLVARWEGCVDAEDAFYSPDDTKRWKIGRMKADGTQAAS